MPKFSSSEAENPRDLAEFVLRWHEFRAVAERALVDMRDDGEKAMVLGWLIRLAECVGPHDLVPTTGFRRT
ncbi:hypothetical protein [uncultured Alsobacter sp.]|uniref:hypothetical protein n=1 Tax=uncultured Alsobacter sp. TaxID=1748258 RepID=UPI0025EB7B13|nr:hypothetical protein [uncultured Alsobacter sp.]